MDITRKRFLASLAGSTMAVLLAGCGGGGGYSAPPPPTAAPGPTPSPTPAPAPGPAPSPAPGPSPSATCGSSGAAISGNHGHSLVVPAADLDATSNMTYDIRGTADHAHTVTLTPAQLASLKTPGSTVTVVSSNTGFHTHNVTVSCV